MFDFDKYGLGQLRTKPTQLWIESDFDKLMVALANEGIVPVLNIPFTSENINALLLVSNCKQCGKCCGFDNSEDDKAGIMITLDELNAIKNHYGVSPVELETKLQNHATEENARILKYPCMFCKDNKCTIWEVRPQVCRVYPLTCYRVDNETYTLVNLNCDYGKEIYKFILKSSE
ncbi:MAG: YkgJ family cysteine cluster protein [Chloroflexi bacterium]|nr:YkgJ family cysteine cluster protein [Chloroflexota bacterium]